MSTTSVLVVTDAGSAGRVLLGRRDVDVRWTLTVEEAVAVVRELHPAVCITREVQAESLLKAFSEIRGAPPVVVLLEDDGWERRHLYFGLGATALASERATDRILEAVSELSGVAFRTCPRVQWSQFLDAQVEGDACFLEAVDLSVSGVSVKNLPSPVVGMRADVSLDECDPPVLATAMVVRVFESGGETIAGMCFVGLEDADRRAIGQLVDVLARREPQLPEPVGFTTDLGGAFTLDLTESVGKGGDANRVYLNMLKEAVRPEGAPLPAWLERVKVGLTSIERRAVLSEDGLPSWALASVLLRIHLKRERLDAPIDIAEREMVRVVEHCCLVAGEAEGAPRDVLCDVASIRAALLREVYEPIRIALRTERVSAPKSQKKKKRTASVRS
jgi:hypothetical protein